MSSNGFADLSPRTIRFLTYSESLRTSSSGKRNLQVIPENEVEVEGPLEALQSSLNSGRFSDLTIIHRSREWKAHKVVVCSQSSVLETMIEEQALESSQSPTSQTPSIQPALVAIALPSFSNTSTPPPTLLPPNPLYFYGPCFSILLHESIFYLSVELEIPALEALAAALYRRTLITKITSPQVYYAMIPRAYTMTTKEHPGLREAVVDVAVRGIGKLLTDDEMRKAFLSVCVSVEDFWVDVMMELAKSKEVVVGLGANGEAVKGLVCEQCEEKGEGKGQQGFEIKAVCKGCGETSAVEFS
ncbi:hypothetical protein ACMFMG_004499 [Clarireedia jacksonii]